MTEPPPSPDTGDDTPSGPGPGPPPGMPGWVKVSGIIVLVLAVLVVIVLLTGLGGPHGPARHQPSGAGDDTPPIAITQVQTPTAANLAECTPPQAGLG